MIGIISIEDYLINIAYISWAELLRVNADQSVIHRNATVEKNFENFGKL